MLIEELIRLGRPLLDGDMKPEDVLRLISDVGGERVKNFYRNVIVVELACDESGEIAALDVQTWGDEFVSANNSKKTDFRPDERKALGIPFVLPTANPINPQGRYGLPVYPVWEKHFETFRKSADGVRSFLHNKKSKAQLTRIDRTVGFKIASSTLDQIAKEVHRVASSRRSDRKEDRLGILILARCGPEDPFEYSAMSDPGKIGDSRLRPGKAILPKYAKSLDAAWTARVEEGSEKGQVRDGVCSISNEKTSVVSAYCKAWPWATLTWNCPLPDGGDDAKLVQGIGLSPVSYRALTLGACVFNRLTRPLHREILREVFSPSGSGPGREQAQRRNDLPTIVGSAFLLPVQDRTLDDPNHRFDFVRGVRKMLAADPKDATQADRFLTGVVGFDVFLPDDLQGIDDYRLTLVYFSGDYTRGDVKLRAFIQDVVPSKLSRLRNIAKAEAIPSMTLLRQLLPYTSEKQQGYYAARYDSVPWLLARAYGGAYLWSQLEALLHCRPLAPGRVTTNLARRLESLVPTWPKSTFEIAEEVTLYLNVLRFLGRVNHDLAGQIEESSMPLRHWKEMLTAVDTGPVEDLLADEPSAAEIGFACGAVIRRFSRAYYMGMLKNKKSPDYLRDRVLTFGSSLRPGQVIDAGLAKIREMPLLQKDIRVNQELESRVGAVINACQRYREQVIDKNKDDFMSGFWSGYCVQGHDRTKNPETFTEATSQTQE